MADALSEGSGVVSQRSHSGAMAMLVCAALSAAGLAYVLLGGDAWLQTRLPARLVLPSLWGVPRWRLLLSPAVLLIAWALGYLLSRFSRGILLRLALRTDNRWDEALVARIGAPLTLFWLLLSMYLLLPWLELAATFNSWANRLSRAGFLLALFWGLSRSLDVFGQAISESGWAKLHAGTLSLVPLAARITKVAVWVLGLVALLSELGYPIASLIAGLGIGGLAVALAAQKTVENLFGAFSIGADQPFREGDFVRVEDFVGTVEVIGLRSTKIRTLDRTLISVPNGKLAEMRLESYSARDRLRLACTVGLVYSTTPAQLRRILCELELVLRAQPKIWSEAVVVRFKEFGDSSLNIEVMAWFQTADWSEFQLIRQNVLLQFMDVVSRAGSSFAFPTRTIHLVSETQLAPSDA